MKSLELFSGAGGLAKGLENAGFQHVAFVENNKDSCYTLGKNFTSEKVFQRDIREFNFSEVGDVDIVAGGPPCQPFSLAGKHQASNDMRDMFPYAIQAIQELQPKAFIFENVKGLLRPSFSDYFDYILARLQYPSHCGKHHKDNWRSHLEDLRDLYKHHHTLPEYRVKFKLINSADFGVPQTRERVIIVGIRSDIQHEWIFPKGNHSFDRLIWDQFVTGEYWERHKIRPIEYPHSAHFLKRVSTIKDKYGLIPPTTKPWLTIRDAIGQLPCPKTKHGITDHEFRDGAKSYPGHTGSFYDLPSKTIKAGAHGVPGGENMIRFSDDSIRYLTVHESKLIQTFPESFDITGAWGESMRQIGNAVPVLLAEQLGNTLNKLLKATVVKKAQLKEKEAA